MPSGRALNAAVLPGVAALALFASGCGGGGDPSSAGPATTEETAGTGGVTEVTMTDFAYTPMAVRVRVGEEVAFVNAGKIDHTVADRDAAGNVVSRRIVPRPIAPGASQRVSLDTPGTVRYLCTFHPTLMEGTITVGP